MRTRRLLLVVSSLLALSLLSTSIVLAYIGVIVARYILLVLSFITALTPLLTEIDSREKTSSSVDNVEELIPEVLVDHEVLDEESGYVIELPAPTSVSSVSTVEVEA